MPSVLCFGVVGLNEHLKTGMKTKVLEVVAQSVVSVLSCHLCAGTF